MVEAQNLCSDASPVHHANTHKKTRGRGTKPVQRCEAAAPDVRDVHVPLNLKRVIPLCDRQIPPPLPAGDSAPIDVHNTTVTGGHREGVHSSFADPEASLPHSGEPFSSPQESLRIACELFASAAHHPRVPPLNALWTHLEQARPDAVPKERRQPLVVDKRAFRPRLAVRVPP